MMATELPKERSDEATVTSATEPTIEINPDAKNVDLGRPHVNGDTASAGTDEIENKHISDIVDDLVNSSEVSISGGSDNEASKAGASKGTDDKGHGRTSSTVKKPSSFKPIQVNQKFLTTKSPAPNPPSKPTDKIAAGTSSASTPGGSSTAPRPRLVAKSGSGLVAKSLTGANGGKAGATPDPNAVWNKNRPPEPKKYTDEELKKYGIHMASRLQPDDPKGQATWADIDDDDDDWAPETITWKDGTKIAIPHTEEPLPPPEPPAPQPQVQVQVQPQPRPVIKENGVAERPRLPTAPSLTGKPGVSVLAAGKGLVLKGAPEKPTLVAKPPAPPTPVKSPWAPIPKVDKVSPIAMDLPPQQHGSRFTPRDGISKSGTPPPPKEIAADDFSRAGWRDHTGGNRELFNSQSGRYEPVQDRRGSVRPDPQHGRQPALLQRASIHEQQGPAEPSAAFQTSRTSEQHVPYGRRRGSSNVSGGSGSFGNRLKGFEQSLPPPEVFHTRRESVTGRSDSPASPAGYSPTGLHGGPRHAQGWPPRASPSITHASPYQQHAQPAHIPIPPVAQPPTPVVVEEDYELQKRLMRERRELAIKRRLEQEAKEEAERKERIRLKLEALGPAPESKSAKKAKDSATTPTQIQSRESISEQSEEQKAEDGPGSNPASSASNMESLPNGVQPHSVPSSDTAESRPPQASAHAHVWPSTAKQPERYPTATWGAQPSKNVWGAPNNNRSLGNGTFVSDLGTTQLPQIPTKSGPGPIAPPSGARPQTNVPSGVLARQPPIGPPKPASRPEQGPSGGRGAGDLGVDRNAWVSAVRLSDEAFREMLNAQYDEQETRLKKEGRGITDVQPQIKDTWRPTTLDESGSRSESAQKQSQYVGQENPWASASDMKATGSQQAPSIPSATPSEYGQRTQSSAANRDATPSASILGSSASAPQPVRGSRFFPSRDPRPETSLPVETQRPKSPSPPPPDMAGHPAFDGDVTHPHVSLPRPQPVVRLPPPTAPEPRAQAPAHAPTGPALKPSGPNFSWANKAAYREPEGHAVPHGPGSAQSESWQAKIDSLLGGGRKHHATKQPAGVDSMSRNAFDHGNDPTTVSFMGFSGRWSAKESSMTTKDMAEGCFEEQEMGSLPPVRLPNDVSELAWQPSPSPPKTLPKKFAVSASSAEAISFPIDVGTNGNMWRVAIPGHSGRNIVGPPHGRTRSNPRRGGSRGGRNPSSTHVRPAKGREPSSSYSNDQGSSSSTPSIPPARNNRGGYRGREPREPRESWSRNAAAIQT